MKVIRSINNNVAVCLDDHNHEVVAFGKGIGFKKVPYEVELSKIDRTYYNLEKHYITLLNELPEDVMNVTFDIVEKGCSFLEIEVNKSFWFSLCDHINFAINNARKGLVLSNPMLNEIQHLYEEEMLLGKWAVRYIDKKMNVKLPTTEAGNIAMHFINARQFVKQNTEKDYEERFVDDISDIIESAMNMIIDRNSFSYSRFVTHLKYLLKRLGSYGQLNSNNVVLYEQVWEVFPKVRKAVEKISEYILVQTDRELSQEEFLYLMVHINRLCTKNEE